MGSSSSHSGSADSVALSVSPNYDFLRGRVALVTGPTSGIGYETARVLAKHGAHVILAARNLTRAEECKQKLIEEIKAELKNSQPQFTILHLNLASLASVRSAANEFLALELPLHLLINNAGIFTLNGKYESTVDGFESHVGSNHLGHYYFTRLLLPKLRATATPTVPAKVVIVSSALHSGQLKNGDDIEKAFVNTQQDYKDLQAYHRSKLFNIYHAQTLAISEVDNNILAFALHPGVIATNIAHSATGMKRFFISVFSPFFASVNNGAATTIHCAFRAVKDHSGLYFADCSVAKPQPIAKDEKLRAKVMEISEKLVLQFEHDNGVTAATATATAQ